MRARVEDLPMPLGKSLLRLVSDLLDSSNGSIMMSNDSVDRAMLDPNAAVVTTFRT